MAHQPAALVGRRCRRCACRRWARGRHAQPLGGEADARQRRRAGSSRRRPPAPAAARRRASRVRRVRSVGRRLGHRAGRCPRGTRPASCPSRWGRGSACGRPPAMAGQPCAWAAVGSGNVVSNHARTGAENRSSATTSTVPTGVTARLGTRASRIDAGSRLAARAGVTTERRTRRPWPSTRRRVPPRLRGVLRGHLRAQARTTSTSSRPASPTGSRSPARPCPR